jgi:hypothetical protein
MRDDLADVVDRQLYIVDMPGLLPLHYQGSADDLGGCHDIRKRVSPVFGEARTEGFEMSMLRSSNAFYLLFI